MERINTVDEQEEPLLPVRRLHNYAYCPRLCYFQWVENVFVDNADTVSGSAVHHGVDRPSIRNRQKEVELTEHEHCRSLELSSKTLGLVGIVDLVEKEGDEVEIVEYKKGSAWRDENGDRIAKWPDRIQLAAHALLLIENGTPPTGAWIYYAGDRKRVQVPLVSSLYDSCRKLIKDAKSVGTHCELPPPLKNDNRCLYCSLYPVCLPSESLLWKDGPRNESAEIRRAPRPDDPLGEVLLVQQAGAYVKVKGDSVQVYIKKEKVTSTAIHQLKQVYIYGAVQMSTQAIQRFLQNEIEVAFFSPAGRFLGLLHGFPPSAADARMGQYRLFGTSGLRVELAREIVRAKIHNQRVMLMRNGEADDKTRKEMAQLRDAIAGADTIAEIRGMEGRAAAVYFGHFSDMLKERDARFDFVGRNRRPPRDPVNALLSMAYSILAKEIAGITLTVGLDPFVGFYHQPKYGRPALALDLMEEFRPLIADSVVISLLNRGELNGLDFVYTSKGVFLKQENRRPFWEAWFRRMETQVTHPQFGYKMSYRRMLEVQARQLWRLLRNEASAYTGFTTR